MRVLPGDARMDRVPADRVLYIEGERTAAARVFETERGPWGVVEEEREREIPPPFFFFLSLRSSLLS